MFKDKLRLCDVYSIVLFSLAWPIAYVKRKIQPDMWLLSERKGEARDNGYWMFRYIKEQQPEQPVYYVIEKNAKDRKKIEKYGSLTDFGSFSHYVNYLAATKHVSAHVDSDSPNSRVSNFLETHGILKNKRVFLQHGITKDKISFGYYSVSRADLFVCGAKPEYEFCKAEFGYPEGTVKLLGFARFDGLGERNPKRQILLMPTWRAWLANVNQKQFSESDYCKYYQKLLNSEELDRLLCEENIELVFYPHSDMQKFINVFTTKCKNIKITSAGQYDIQALLNESALLITDYSSVAFDMAYMHRPIIYFHFDYDDYRKGQHPEGYFEYICDGFGPVVYSYDGLMKELRNSLNNDFCNTNYYEERVNAFFDRTDKKNCNRIYEAIKDVK